ncbi:MAG: hypothetical protein WCH34_15590 [Bacteroidota bacterium]
MKKIFYVLVGITFITVLFLNIKISANQKKVSDIQLKNLEASACYFVYDESVPPPYGFYQCCSPWWNICNSNLGLQGTWYPM